MSPDRAVDRHQSGLVEGNVSGLGIVAFDFDVLIFA